LAYFFRTPCRCCRAKYKKNAHVNKTLCLNDARYSAITKRIQLIRRRYIPVFTAVSISIVAFFVRQYSIYHHISIVHTKCRVAHTPMRCRIRSLWVHCYSGGSAAVMGRQIWLQTMHSDGNIGEWRRRYTWRRKMSPNCLWRHSIRFQRGGKCSFSQQRGQPVTISCRVR